MQQYIEEEIIKQLRDPAHQRDAFAQVVNFYGEKLYWQIRKMVLDHDDANDLLQNTFLKAWMNIDYFRGKYKKIIIISFRSPSIRDGNNGSKFNRTS